MCVLRPATNQMEQLEHRRRLTGIIDYTLLGEGISQRAFDRELAAQQISVVRGDGLRKPGIWYVDHLTKEIYEGRRLGEHYSGRPSGSGVSPTKVARNGWPRNKH